MTIRTRTRKQAIEYEYRFAEYEYERRGVHDRAKTRKEGNQQAAHSLGKTSILRYAHHAETPTWPVGFTLPLALASLAELSH